jgi:hypothetical protein
VMGSNALHNGVPGISFMEYILAGLYFRLIMLSIFV